jgi:hypothetical protein
LGIYFSIDYQNIYSAIGGVGLITLLAFVFGQLGRDNGKKAEKKLWTEWGGAPTTQILRVRNTVLDKFTTQKVHKDLHLKTNIGFSDMNDKELVDSDEADEIYVAWSNYLRGLTRDTKKYNLLFQENINYGFRRNLWGIKSIGIFLVIGAFTIISIHSYLNGQLFETSNYLLWVSSLLLFILFLFWFFVVSKKWIKIVAFAYAERLIESLGTI